MTYHAVCAHRRCFHWLHPVPAFAQTLDLEDKRFTFHKVDDGFLRLDGRTGAVSLLCRRPRERMGLRRGAGQERRRSKIECAPGQNENANLKRRGHYWITRQGVAWLTAAPARGRWPEQDRAERRRGQPRVMAFMEKLWLRMRDMIANVRRRLSQQVVEDRLLRRPLGES